MILIYRIFTNILYPFLIVFMYLRVLLKKEDPERYKEKILVKSFNVKKNNNLNLIWFHAASIGEFKSIVPIIKKLNDKRNDLEFLITTTTLSSGILASTELKKISNTHHRFLPIDVEYLIEEFFERWKPKVIFLVDSEIWPNLILKAKQKKISISLINARLTKKSFKRWFFFLQTAKKIFEIFDLCLCSNRETEVFLEKLNAKNIKYFGNIKLINKINKKKFNVENSKFLSQSRFWLAASIHEKEDKFCLKTHIELKKYYNDLVTIIVPRHIHRSDKIKTLSDNFNLKAQILNEGDKISDEIEIIIVNSYGFLQNYYEHAKSVFIGKSVLEKFINDGGQNPIDAAYSNCKIYHGPYISNFTEVYKIMRDNNISKEINNYEELSKNLASDLKNPKKKENSYSNIIQSMGDEILSNTIKSIENLFHDKNF